MWACWRNDSRRRSNSSMLCATGSVDPEQASKPELTNQAMAKNMSLMRTLREHIAAACGPGDFTRYFRP